MSTAALIKGAISLAKKVFVPGLLLALIAAPSAQAQPVELGLRSLATISGSMCLDAWNGPAEWRKLVVTTCWNNANQDFRLKKIDGQPQHALLQIGKFCVVASTGNLNGSDLKLMSCDGNNRAQWWELLNSEFHQGPEALVTSFRFDNKCIDVAGNPLGLAAGKTLDVHMWDCNGQKNQRWGYDARAK